MAKISTLQNLPRGRAVLIGGTDHPAWAAGACHATVTGKQVVSGSLAIVDYDVTDMGFCSWSCSEVAHNSKVTAIVALIHVIL